MDNEKATELKKVNFTGLFITFLIIGILALTAFMFVFSYDKPLFRSLSNMESEDLKNLREKEESTLSSYRVIDREKDVYAIPVDKAMEYVVRDYNQSK